MRPVLVPSRLEDPPIKVLFAGQRWMRVEGGRGAVEIDDDEHVIYMLLGLRNVGAGIAVLRGWYIDHSEQFSLTATPPPLEAFRRQQRDLYIPVGDPGYWQGALRDPTDPDFDQVIAELHDRNAVTIHVLYGDHEGGQRVISRFAIVPIGDSGWLCQVTRHWNIDNDDPR
jgi:hypothetical protein